MKPQKRKDSGSDDDNEDGSDEEEEEDSGSDLINNKNKISKDFYSPLEDQEFNTLRQGVIRSMDYSESNAFVIKQVSEEEKMETLYVHSAIPVLNKIVEIYKSSSEKELTLNFTKRV